MKNTAIRLLRLHRNQSGQSAFEYLLVLAVIVPPLVAALYVGFETIGPSTVAFICSTIDSAGVGSCFG